MGNNQDYITKDEIPSYFKKLKRKLFEFKEELQNIKIYQED